MLVVIFALLISIFLLYRSLLRLKKENQELLEGKKAADVTKRIKNDFLVNMSHEIRTPLNAILGFTEILVHRISANGQNQYQVESEGIFDILRKSSKDLLTIVNDILDFLKIEANLLHINSVPVSVRQILDEIGHKEMSNTLAKHLDFSIEYKDTIPDVILCDPDRLRQIIDNLVDNAIKYTDRGSIKIRCSCLLPHQTDLKPKQSDAEHDANHYLNSRVLRIDVTDTGIGISETQLAKLFDPFLHVESSTTRGCSNTGLGLNISKRLANLLDGDIRVTSTPGVGSTFTLFLNVFLPAEGDSRVPHAPEQYEADRPLLGSTAVMPSDETLKKSIEDSIETTTPRENRPDRAGSGDQQRLLNRIRILLVEDLHINQIVISTLLKSAGAIVEIESNGEEGIKRINSDMDNGLFFDVVLMDMRMPVMDGYEATKALRAQGYTRPIIAVTAYALIGDRESTLEAGCNDYVSKPVDRMILINTIKKYCK